MRDFFANTLDLLAGGGAAIAGFLHGMTNGQGRTAILLAALMGADYVSGVLAAALGRSRKTAHGRLSSQAGWKGLLRKAVILLVVGLSVLLDWYVGQGSAMFQTAVMWFYISNETLSLLENLGRCGVPIPKKLRDMLEELGKSEEEKQTEVPYHSLPHSCESSFVSLLLLFPQNLRFCGSPELSGSRGGTCQIGRAHV